MFYNQQNKNITTNFSHLAFHKVKSVSGFTLIEVIVTIAIITVAFFGIIQIFPFSLKVNKASQNLTTAGYLAQSGMEQILSTSYEETATGIIEAKNRLSADSSSYLYYFQRELDVEYVDADLQTSVTDLGLKKITTTVFWEDAMSTEEKTYILSTLVSKK